MTDDSYLDLKYFIDEKIYNCPFCNRGHVTYELHFVESFDWTDKKKCWVYFVKCNSCERMSMHLSYKSLYDTRPGHYWPTSYIFKKGIDLDAEIFYSVPTSFFVLDDRIPVVIRELITEAEGCIKMNFLTGASACMRKAIYELLVIEKAEGTDYESKIKSLKKKYTESDPQLFDILSHIQDMTSDKIHEQSWDQWNSQYLRLIIETLKTVLHDIYVTPKVKAGRSIFIQSLLQKVSVEKKDKTGNSTKQ
jgi:hypothetical protein